MKNEKLNTLLCIFLAAVIIGTGVFGMYSAYAVSDDKIGDVCEYGFSDMTEKSSDFRTVKTESMYPWSLLDDSAEKLSGDEYGYSLRYLGEALCQSFLFDCLWGVNIEKAQIYLCRDMLFVIDCPIIAEKVTGQSVSFVIDDEKRLIAFDFSLNDGIYENTCETKEYKEYLSTEDISYCDIADILAQIPEAEQESFVLWMDERFYQYIGQYNITVDFMAEYCNYLLCTGGSVEDAYSMAEILSSDNSNKDFDGNTGCTEYTLGENKVTLYGAGRISGMTRTFAENGIQ